MVRSLSDGGEFRSICCNFDAADPLGSIPGMPTSAPLAVPGLRNNADFSTARIVTARRPLSASGSAKIYARARVFVRVREAAIR